MIQTVKSRRLSTRGQFICDRKGQYVSFPCHHHHHHHSIIPHIHRRLHTSVLLTEGQAGETTTKYQNTIFNNIYYDTYDCTQNGNEQPKKSKRVNTPSNIGGPLDRLQTLSGRPKYR